MISCELRLLKSGFYVYQASFEQSLPQACYYITESVVNSIWTKNQNGLISFNVSKVWLQ